MISQLLHPCMRPHLLLDLSILLGSKDLSAWTTGCHFCVLWKSCPGLCLKPDHNREKIPKSFVPDAHDSIHSHVLGIPHVLGVCSYFERCLLLSWCVPRTYFVHICPHLYFHIIGSFWLFLIFEAHRVNEHPVRPGFLHTSTDVANHSIRLLYDNSCTGLSVPVKLKQKK